MDSILDTIRGMILGEIDDDETYSTDLVIHINSVFADLKQLGVGPPEGFTITGSYETWSDFTKDKNDIESVKTYIYMRVRLMFDPPTSSALLKSLEDQIAKFEWRLNVAAETV